MKQFQKLSGNDSLNTGTFVLVSAVVYEKGQISHWELVASKPGKIRVQVK